MTNNDATTNVIELNAYRHPDQLAALRLRERAAEIRKLRETLMRPPVPALVTPPSIVKTDVSSEVAPSLEALDELIAIDRRRVRAMQALRKLVTDTPTLQSMPQGRIAKLIADRDNSPDRREKFSSAVWYHVGLVSGLHARDSRGDIVDAPVSAVSAAG